MINMPPERVHGGLNSNSENQNSLTDDLDQESSREKSNSEQNNLDVNIEAL